MAEIELSSDPRSTHGATEAYKVAWHKKYGKAEPAGNASKPEWVDYAVAQGASRDEAEGMTVSDLKDAYAGKGIGSTPSQDNSPSAQAEDQSAAGGGPQSGTPGATPTTTSGAGTSVPNS